MKKQRRPMPPISVPKTESHDDFVARLRKLAEDEGAATVQAHYEFNMLVDPRIIPEDDEDSQAGQPS